MPREILGRPATAFVRTRRVMNQTSASSLESGVHPDATVTRRSTVADGLVSSAVETPPDVRRAFLSLMAAEKAGQKVTGEA